MKASIILATSISFTVFLWLISFIVYLLSICLDEAKETQIIDNFIVAAKTLFFVGLAILIMGLVTAGLNYFSFI